MKAIQVYFKGGEDPFGNDKKYIGLSQQEWMKKIEAE